MSPAKTYYLDGGLIKPLDGVGPNLDPAPSPPPPTPRGVWWAGFSTGRQGLSGSEANKRDQAMLRCQEMATQAGVSAATIRAASHYHGYNPGMTWDAATIPEFQFAKNNGWAGIMMNQKVSGLSGGLAAWAAGDLDASFTGYLTSIQAVGLSRNIVIIDHEPNNNSWTSTQQGQWRQGTARFMKITAQFGDPRIIYSTCLVPNTGGDPAWNPRPELNTLMGSAAAAQTVMDKTFAGCDPYPEMENDGVTPQTLEGRCRKFLNANLSWGFTRFCMPEVAFFNYKSNGSGPGSLTAAQQAQRLTDQLWTWARANRFEAFSYFDVSSGWTGTGSTTDGSNPRSDSRMLDTPQELLTYSKILRGINPGA